MILSLPVAVPGTVSPGDLVVVDGRVIGVAVEGNPWAALDAWRVEYIDLPPRARACFHDGCEETAASIGPGDGGTGWCLFS